MSEELRAALARYLHGEMFDETPAQDLDLDVTAANMADAILALPEMRAALATPDRADILYKKGLRDTESKEGCAECERQERLLGADPTEEWVAEAWSQATPHPHFATPDRADPQDVVPNFNPVEGSDERTVAKVRRMLAGRVTQDVWDDLSRLATPDRADPDGEKG